MVACNGQDQGRCVGPIAHESATVAVDALDEVAGFCAAHWFVRLPDSLRLVLPMRIAAAGTERMISLRYSA